MIRKYLLPMLSVCGVLFAVFVVVKGSKPTAIAQPASPPPESVFKSTVAGRGIVEANSQNIAVAANVPGVVTQVLVKVGDGVDAGTPLFKLDNRSLTATLAAQQAALKQANGKLSRLKAAPRPEEIPPAEALVRKAEAGFSDARTQLESAQSLGDSRAISREELTHRRFTLAAAESKLRNAQANLALLKAGTWKPDLEVAEADVDYAKSQVQSTQIAIDLLTVKAPVRGQVLQLNVRSRRVCPGGSTLHAPRVIWRRGHVAGSGGCG